MHANKESIQSYICLRVFDIAYRVLVSREISNSG